jgi:diketogulonate reductase-like aldo/keto reductase
MKKIDSRVKLNNGIEMPYFGLGVYLIHSGEETFRAVQHALNVGYRLIDTARMYDNEEDVGRAVQESSIPRSEIFVTTKLWNSDHGYDKALRAFQRSLEALRLDYINLYLIHWPVEGLRRDTWRALETVLEEGKCRAIGVSNYTIPHLKDLLGKARIVPAVNQVEFSPFLYQKELFDFCREQGIQMEAYSPLTRGKKFKDKTLRTMAEKYDKTAAQILIRWALQHDLVVIPKSSHPGCISENADVFDFLISEEDMLKMDKLNENFRVSWNPTRIP